MMTANKRLTKSFREYEFRCKCRRKECDAVPMDPGFMQLLQQLRDEWGRPMEITSGSRCAHWNTLKGGTPKSMHLAGKAADIWLETPDQGRRLFAICEKVGFGGVGVGRLFIHVDSGAPGRRWTYD